jgi:hypothetical protein
MSDPSVDAWKQQGQIFLWRFSGETRNFPGWNFCADEAGCESTAQLLQLMQRARWASKRTLHVTRVPDEFINPREPAARSRLIVPRHLTLSYRRDRVESSHWHWDGNWSEPTVLFGTEKLSELACALRRMSLGEGDFRVGSDEQRLHGIDASDVSIWFWPVVRLGN